MMVEGPKYRIEEKEDWIYEQRSKLSLVRTVVVLIREWNGSGHVWARRSVELWRQPVLV